MHANVGLFAPIREGTDARVRPATPRAASTRSQYRISAPAHVLGNLVALGLAGLRSVTGVSRGGGAAANSPVKTHA